MPLFITVTPGTTVSNTTVLDPTVLNLLGNPAIDINGTVDGGSLSLAAGSVTTSALADDAVTFPKIQNIGTDRLLGRDTNGAGDVEELTVSGGLGFTGSGGIEITNNQVGYGKIQQVTGSRLLGNPTGSSANVSEIPLGTGLAFQGGALVNTGVPRYRADFTFVDYSAYTLGITLASNGDPFSDATDYTVFCTEFVPTNFSHGFWVGNCTGNTAGIVGFSLQYTTANPPTSGWTDVAGSTLDVNNTSGAFKRVSSTVSIGGSPTLVFWRAIWKNTTSNDAALSMKNWTLSLWN